MQRIIPNSGITGEAEKAFCEGQQGLVSRDSKVLVLFSRDSKVLFREVSKGSGVLFRGVAGSCFEGFRGVARLLPSFVHLLISPT